MFSIFDEFKQAWSKPNNGLAQLIIINVVIFVIFGILYVLGKIPALEFILPAVYKQFTIPAPIGEFITRPWTIITYAFTHSLTDMWHIIMNMLVFYWFGRIFVDTFGSQKLINLYVLGAIAGGVTYLLAYNLIPFYADRATMFNGMVGASAAVYAVSVAAATYFPDYRFYLLFFGPVRIKYIVAVYIFFSFLGSVGDNAGGNLAHLGGALMGFVYIKQLNRGNELGRWVFHIMEFVKSFFIKRPVIKVSHRQTKQKSSASEPAPKKSGTTAVNQAEIDKILDKISDRGYDSLTKEEKEKLFNASK